MVPTFVLFGPTAAWGQATEACRYGEWSEPVAVGEGGRIVRFGSIAEFSDRELVFVGSELRNFETDTIRSTPFSLLSTAGRFVPPPTGEWHWQSHAEPMPDGRLAVLWGESERVSFVPLLLNYPSVHLRLRMALLSEVDAWSEPLTLIESAESAIFGTYGWAVTTDAGGLLHVAVNKELSLFHIVVDGDDITTRPVASGGLFAPTIAARGDTLLVAAIGPTSPNGRQPILLGRSSDSGTSWETRWLEAQTTGLMHSLTLHWESARPMLAWTEGLTANGRLEVVRVLRLLPGFAFEERPRLRLPSGAMRVQFGEDECGSVHVLYTNLVGGLNAEDGRIEYRRLERGRWTPPVQLSSRGSALEVYVRKLRNRFVAAWTTVTVGGGMVTEHAELTRHQAWE